MIDGKVIRDISRIMPFKAEALEKDYVMNLILDAIARCPKTKDSVFLKGGNCIYKCFYHENGLGSQEIFETPKKGKETQKALLCHYLKHVRLSKDLDLTVSPELMNEAALVDAFQEVGAYLKSSHGLEICEFSFPIHENTKQKIEDRYKKNCRGIIHFKGPLFSSKFQPPKLSIDLTSDEKVVLNPEKRSVHHVYTSDESEQDLIANTYRFEDVFAEKFRSLFERCSSRDLFDIIFLARHPKQGEKGNLNNKAHIGFAIIEKFRIKNIPLSLDHASLNYRFKDQTLIDAKEEFKKGWEKFIDREKQDTALGFENVWKEIEHIVTFGKECVHAANDKLVGLKNKYPGEDLNTLFNSEIRKYQNQDHKKEMCLFNTLGTSERI